MAAPTLIEIMEALEERYATVGLRMKSGTPDGIAPPAGVVIMPDIESYRDTMRRGSYTLEIDVMVLVSPTWSRSAQRRLAEYASVVGEKSIPRAVESERTLGGVVQDVIVTAYQNLNLEEAAAIEYFGGRFTNRCVVKGN